MNQADKKPAGERGPGRNIRRDFIEAGLELFGECGLEGTSTRLLAQKAGANISGIAYYFGGKENLYLAVAEHVSQRLAAFTQEVCLEIRRELERSPDRPRILALILKLTGVLTGRLTDFDQVKYAAKIMLREQTGPSAAFDLLYEGFIKDRLGLLADLIARYTGLPSGDQVVVIAHTLVGQALALVVTRGALLKNLGCERIDAAGLELINRVIMTNIEACLDKWAAAASGAGL